MTDQTSQHIKHVENLVRQQIETRAKRGFWRLKNGKSYRMSLMSCETLLAEYYDVLVNHKGAPCTVALPYMRAELERQGAL